MSFFKKFFAAFIIFICFFAPSYAFGIARVAVINKLTGFSSYVDLRVGGGDVYNIGDKYRMSVKFCSSEEFEDVKSYVADVLITRQAKPSEVVFDGKVYSEFMHKSQFNDKLFAINLISCS